MDENEKHLLEIEAYNLFNGGKFLSWSEVLQNMSAKFNRDRDQVYETMNKLIDEKKIEVCASEMYAHPGIWAKKQEKEEREAAQQWIDANAKTLSRKEYDLLNPKEQSDFCQDGGQIV